MQKMLRPVLSMVMIFLSGLVFAGLSDNPLIPKEEAAFAQEYIQALRQRSFDHVKKHLSPGLESQITDQKLEEIAKFFPVGKTISTELIGSHVHTVNSTWQGNFTFEYQFEGGWAVANVVMKRVDQKFSVVAFNVHHTENSQREINRFSILGKSLLHYAVLVAAAAVPLFIVATLVFCVRTPIPRRKWLWMLFILFGIGSISINWTTGATDFRALQFLLLGGAYVRSGEYAPVVITAALPIGAIVFWFKRRNFFAASLAEKSAQSTPESPRLQ